MSFIFHPIRTVFLLLVMAVVAVSTISAAHAQTVKARKNVAVASAREKKERKAIEANVRKGVATFFGISESVVESVTHIPRGGLYEIVLNNGDLFYTDKAVSFFIFGNIIDARTRRNLTGERLDERARIDFKSLPLEQAVERVNGSGQRVMVTFEDPNCGYCKRLNEELKKVKDVTIYTFLYPILSDDSITKSRHIWCAKNRAATWTAWITKGKAPEARNCDSDTIENNVVLGRKLRVTAIPTMFFPNGARIAGYRDASDLEQILAEISAEADR
ncbi:MAG: DsbC family protein [Betaproteobacteria bacterium]|nr:DsbC family protein [Betaproteobacteria bacterium]